jgi:hypothetical protein
VILSQQFPGGVGENHEKPVRIAGVLGKIQTENLPNMNSATAMPTCPVKLLLHYKLCYCRKQLFSLT